MTCRFVDGQGKRGNVHIPAIMSVAFPDVVSFSCGVVYSRGNRTPESKKKADVGVSHQTENEKENFLYLPGTYISPFVVALASGGNSNPSSRERFFLRTANPRQDPNSCIHYDIIWRHTAAHLQEDDTKPCSNKQDLNSPTGVHPIYS